jgi:VWFA-related protein
VDLVSVPVVVRDAQGRPVGDLSREDFQLSDSGKPQTVSKFSVEKLGQAVEAQTGSANPQARPAPATPVLPERFVAFLFDDMNLNSSDLERTREAAWNYLQASLRSTERAAIATTSGIVTLDFTADRDRLHETLLKINARTPIVNLSIDCPPITIYQADLIVNKDDPDAFRAALSDLNVCTGGQPLQRDQPAAPHTDAQSRVFTLSRQVLSLADRYAHSVLGTLDALIGKMAVMAGQRTIVLASPGFQILDDRRPDESGVFEHALRANVVINALDARGLYTAAPGVASEHSLIPVDPMNATLKDRWARAAALANRALMDETASATGGRFFENSNDLSGGIEKLAAAPEYIYVLGFNPQGLKLDGKFHPLKVALKDPHGYMIEARRGYYAPRNLTDTAERAREEIKEAFFGRDETRDMPVAVETQFVKPSPDRVTLNVAARIDVKALTFRLDHGLRVNDLTLVAGVFDSDGVYVSGVQKVVQMRLRDETYQAGLNSGLTLRYAFDLTPGVYLLRLVARDSEGRLMASRNATVEIP